MSENPRLLDRQSLRLLLAEELDRARRYGRAFSVLTFQELPAADGLSIREKMRLALELVDDLVRASDIIAQPYEDTLVIVLVETDEAGARDALFRLRNRLASRSGSWRTSLLTFPADADAIQAITVPGRANAI
jgi:hypothetical protein